MKPTVEKITDKKSLTEAFKIRQLVFVIEQVVDPEAEYDEFEEESTHFLGRLNEKPVGTARWRFTKNGVKLERFAVLAEARCKGVGQALVAAVLEDVKATPESADKSIYLHSQLAAISLYAKFGFQKVGDLFEECNMQHYKMELA